MTQRGCDQSLSRGVTWHVTQHYNHHYSITEYTQHLANDRRTASEDLGGIVTQKMLFRRKKLIFSLLSFCENFFWVSSVSTKCVEIETLLRPIISFSPVTADWTRERGTLGHCGRVWKTGPVSQTRSILHRAGNITFAALNCMKALWPQRIFLSVHHQKNW